MKKIKKIKKSFIEALKEISKRKIDNFSGIGLLLYSSKFLSNTSSVNLRPSAKCPKGMFISKKEVVDFLLEISQNSHFLHEGYHFFNEDGRLAHISQYLITLNIPGVIPNELHGARYLSAKLGSYMKGVICTGIVTRNYEVFYFEKGKSYKLMGQWDNIYKKGGDDYKYYNIIEPHKDIDKVVKMFKEKNVKRVLDLGCGAGKHLIYLAQQGFEVYGIDMAEEGVRIAKKTLRRANLKAKLKIGDVFEKLPYRDNLFDAIISVQVLQHGSLNQIKRAISEIERILKPGGLLFVTLCGRYSKGKERYCLVKTAKKIAPRTYVPTIGDEAGLIHYIYDKRTLRKHYKNFKIIDMWNDDKDYYCFLGENKKGK